MESENASGKKVGFSKFEVFDSNLLPHPFDAIDFVERDGDDNPTIIDFYSGGLEGTKVSTLTLTYESNLVKTASSVSHLTGKSEA